ncbi:ABC transporter substrate-binding protein [Clostridium estertheticum]|uniref:ABC transporter substrate-binding protein n=1 Tax=Clostridium estertheticum TaxID=238834 RepID=UPI001CF4CAB7|nr:ABC transporter substrate-binding protein [Clostridium estertheticum]MCB2357966.1 ABC transporter substrate-binding protein [Clostridium estertheticum]
MRKSNIFLKNICVVLLILITVFSLSSCKWGSDKKSEDQKKLNIFLDTTDEHSYKVNKFLIDDYKKNNPDVVIKLNDIIGDKSNIMDTINLGTEIDVMFTSRNDFIELSKKGVLSDMDGTYEDNNINSRYFNIIGSYGRIGDKYYGIGVVPYSIELFYNKANLKKLKIANPNNLKEWLNVLKQINGKGLKTPVVLNEDIDASGILFSLIASTGINIHEVEESYDGGEQGYKKLKNMQGVFDEFNLLIKNNGITKDSFELGNEQSVTNFNNGDSPLLMCNSYYNPKLNGNNIGVIKEYDNDSKFGANMPIIINSILSIPVNAKNRDRADAFIQYVYSDETQARLVQKGIITGNKVANKKILGIGKSMVQHMYKANDNSIPILYNLPKKIKNNVLLTLKRIIDGNYNSKEWEEILKESYK